MIIYAPIQRILKHHYQIYASLSYVWVSYYDSLNQVKYQALGKSAFDKGSLLFPNFYDVFFGL